MDALRLLPPDLQQYLLEMPLACSVEIVDSWVFLQRPIAEAGRRLRTSPTKALVAMGIVLALWLMFIALSDNLLAFIS